MSQFKDAIDAYENGEPDTLEDEKLKRELMIEKSVQNMYEKLDKQKITEIERKQREKEIEEFKKENPDIDETNLEYQFYCYCKEKQYYKNLDSEYYSKLEDNYYSSLENSNKIKEKYNKRPFSY